MAKINKFLGLLGLVNKEERIMLIGNDGSGTLPLLRTKAVMLTKLV
jgi:hypothetical protein